MAYFWASWLRVLFQLFFIFLLDKFDAFAKALTMAKQKFRPTRLGGFSGAKAYI
jgi:hypothetical protein